MNKSDGKLKLTFNFVVVCTGWQNGTCMPCIFGHFQLFNLISCVTGVRIEFSCVLKNYQHKSIKHPLSPQ